MDFKMKYWFKIFFTIFFINISYAANNTIDAGYDFTYVPNQWITMPDGVKLSVSYWIPKAKFIGERFPVVLEALPYRKDDSHYTTDYPLQAYLARHGIVGVRLDLRGTGSSQGVTPDREYDDHELTDIPIVIESIAAKPWSNGNVGMQGKSWGAFNSIMIAMQRPPHLKGIFIAHGSQDLYANDIHNIDGALHLDIFTIEIDVDNILPATPYYKIDKNYFADRFDQEPWIFTFLKHQQDDAFWETHRSLKNNFSAINIPIFAVASLLDGYRDYAIDMLNHVKSPMLVAMGPQNHAWPNAAPGPRYEWRQQSVRFWQQTLNGKDTGILQEPNFLVYMREAVPPNVNLEHTPGHYWAKQWPIKDTVIKEFLLQADGSLNDTKGKAVVHSLKYTPSTGKGILNWWGETTPNMKPADKGSLVYDSPIQTRDLYLLGNPAVTLEVSANAPLADWIVRLEDVNPDGKVSFITGGLINGAHRLSRTKPEALPINKNIIINIPLHFSSWKFAKGHKIRLAISNAQFPMVWPTPYKMTTTLTVGNGKSKLFLPLVSKDQAASPTLPALEPDDVTPSAKELASTSLTPFTISHDKEGNTIATAIEAYTAEIHGNIYKTDYKAIYKVNDQQPAKASFIGIGIDRVNMLKAKRNIKVESTITVNSDDKYFHTQVIRKISLNGKILKVKKWNESIPRYYQ